MAPPVTGRASTSYNTKPINSFFTPNKKPEEKTDRPKIAVKNVLKSNSLTTLASKSQYNPIRKPGSLFTLSKNITKRSDTSSNNSSTENLTENLANFRFDGDIHDLNSPRKLNQRVITTDDEEESDDNNIEASPQRVLRTRKPIRKPAPIVFSSEEEEDDEEEKPVKLKKRRKVVSDSEEEEDDDPMMDDDEAYVDQNEAMNKMFESASEKENVERVQRIHPNKSVEEILDAIRRAGSVVAACKLLMDDENIPKQKRRRLMNNDEDDDEREIQARKQLSEREREILVLKYFNTCTGQDLQEVTGCKSEAAEKITQQLRPFSDMEDLEEKLRQTKGTSVKYIQACREMMDGYTAVDEIIEKIENLGSKLRNILTIWEGVSRSNSPASDDDEETGMHMTRVDIDKDKAKYDPVYRDAMNGYLTEQPECVDKAITLKDYQILGVNWLLLLYRKGISGILADEMGLGKTCQIITFLGRLNELGDRGPHLIVVPSSTIENWVREFERFCPDLEIRVYHGSMNDRQMLRAELKAENKMRIFQVVLTTYQIAAGHIDDRTFLRKLKCRSMILDEGHMVKNCASGRYARLMNINTPFRLLLTGTPLQNSLQELVSLLVFIMPETFANHEEEVRSIFKIRVQASSKDNKDEKKNKDETSLQVLSKARITRAKKMMTPFVLRRKKEDVLKDMPNKTQIIERCTMTENQAQVYSDIILNSKKSYEASLDKAVSSDMKKQFENMSNIVVHLRKAADHPLLFRRIYTDELLKEMAKEIRRDVKYWDSEEAYIYEDMTFMSDFELHNLCLENRTIKQYQLKNEEWMDSGKIERLKKLLPEYKQKGHKVLIFSQFTKMLDILEKAMETMGTSYVRLDGDTKVMERQDLIDDFNNNEDLDVFLLSTKAGGFGINLTSANVVILYDLDFNPQNDKQAEDRAHRVGQTKEVLVHKLIAEDSIEEYILKMANIKLKLDKNISSDADAIEEEEESNQKKSLQAILKEAFRYDDLKAKTSSNKHY